MILREEPMTTVYFVRHAQPNYDLEGIEIKLLRQ